jgi:transcriptional regulator
MQDRDWSRRNVAELTAQQERDGSRPSGLSDAPEEFIEVMLRGIVGFRFAITRLEAKSKMSQNREMKDGGGVVKGLCQRGRSDNLEVAFYGFALTSARRHGEEPPPKRCCAVR